VVKVEVLKTGKMRRVEHWLKETCWKQVTGDVLKPR